MRKHSSWATRLVVVGLLISSNVLPAQAQNTDFAHIGVQLAEFANKAREWVKTVQNYAVVKDAFEAAQTANQISNNIKSVTDQVRDLTNQGLALQQRIQADLKLVANIRNLRVSNMIELRNLALNLSSTNFASRLPSLGQTQRFTQALTVANDTDAEIAKEEFTMVSSKQGVRRNARDMREQQRNAVMAQLAVEHQAQEDKIVQAFQYRKLADEMTATAVELQASTNTDNAMSMTDGERVTVQNQSAAMLREAIELREKASALIASAAQKGPTQLAAEKVIMDQMQVAGFAAMHEASHPNEDPAY